MRRIILVAAVVLGLVLGWLAAPLVIGGETAEMPATPVVEPTINPPPQVPEVAIPPIPQVDEDDTFKPAEPPEAAEAPAVSLDEGKRLFHREGRLALDDEKHAIFVFDSGDKPMRLLENSWRQFLETTTDFGKKEARRRVSGLITVYHQRNYLLLTKCIRMMPEEEGR